LEGISSTILRKILKVIWEEKKQGHGSPGVELPDSLILLIEGLDDFLCHQLKIFVKGPLGPKSGHHESGFPEANFRDSED
jgi:hypothetical protein